MNIIAGIVTFNPELQRLEENLNALTKQVERIVVVDNGSGCIEEIALLCANYRNNKIEIIRNAENQGIAAALAQIMDYAEKARVEWVLSLDQDSVVVDGLISSYEQCVLDNKDQDVAMLTCQIVDRNFVVEYKNADQKYTQIELCITSGSLISTKLYKNVSGYDRHFFIDLVDFDLCCQFREKRYKIIRVNVEGLVHEVGHGKNVTFFGKKIVVYNEPAERNYYAGRNLMLMHWKHRKYYTTCKVFAKILKKLIRVGLYEQGKVAKLTKYFSGIRKGLQEREVYR